MRKIKSILMLVVARSRAFAASADVTDSRRLLTRRASR